MKSRAFLLFGLAIAGVSHAQLSSTVTLVSDYEFRGVSLTEGDPALQASLDYAFDSGFALGAWASNLDYGDDYDGNYELDVYASYVHEISQSLAWGAGVTAYTYPDSEDIEDFLEGYVDLTAGDWRAAQWYAHDYSGLGVSALYSEVNYSHQFAGKITVLAHLGYSWGDYWNDSTQGGGELLDYSLGAEYTLGRFTLAGKLTGADAGEREITSGAFRNDARLVFSIATTFPWTAADD